VSVSVTTPVKPLRAVTVMVDVALTPTLTAAGEVAVIWKSGVFLMLNTALVVWTREPLVPVIVRV